MRQCKLRLVEPADRGLTIAEHLLSLCVDGSNSVKAIAQVTREAMLGGSDPSKGATADVQQLVRSTSGSARKHAFGMSNFDTVLDDCR